MHVGAAAGAAARLVRGQGRADNGATGRVLHMPVWLRVLDTTPSADVLLVDDDGSSADPGFPDYADVYTSMFDSLGVIYDYRRPVERRLPVVPRPVRLQGRPDLHREQRQLRHERVLPGRPGRASRSGSTAAASSGRPARTSPRRATATRLLLRRASAARGCTTATSGSSTSPGSAYGGGPAPRYTAEGKGPMKKLKHRPQPGRRRRRQPDLDRGLGADAGQRHLRGQGHDDRAVRRPRRSTATTRASRSAARRSRA